MTRFDTIRRPWPRPEQVEREMDGTLQALAQEGVKLDAVTISGNGELTLHPDFLSCVQAVLRVGEWRLKGVRTGVFPTVPTWTATTSSAG